MNTSTPDAWIYGDENITAMIARDKQNEEQLVKETVQREERKTGDPLPGYKTHSVMSSMNTVDVVATLPPMSEDELLDTCYSGDMQDLAKQNLSYIKARKKALDESDVKMTLLLRDVQRCESLDELKRVCILPALEERAKNPSDSWYMAHRDYYNEIAYPYHLYRIHHKKNCPQCASGMDPVFNNHNTWKCICGCWWAYTEKSGLTKTEAL